MSALDAEDTYHVVRLRITLSVDDDPPIYDATNDIGWSGKPPDETALAGIQRDLDWIIQRADYRLGGFRDGRPEPKHPDRKKATPS